VSSPHSHSCTPDSPCPHHHGHGEAPVGRDAERKLSWAFWLTTVFMGAELLVGHLASSVALTADGWHMASHAVALGVALYAHRHAKAFANDERYSLGTGKVSSLAGFASSIALGFATLGMVWEAGERWLDPRPISFNAAITVAVLGLVLNLVTAVILQHDHDQHHDHNLKAAYLHVLADALTSVLAVVALLGAKTFGFLWLDPLVALVGAAMVWRWAWALMRQTAHVLLDRAAAPEVIARARTALMKLEGTEIVHLTAWAVGSNEYAVRVAVTVNESVRIDELRKRLHETGEFRHAFIEVHTGK